jgi:hypothetical protein
MGLSYATFSDPDGNSWLSEDHHLVYGVASLPLGTPVELEVIFEVAG